MVIKDIDLSKIRFFNIDYRHYVGIWKIDLKGVWIVHVHPFSVKLKIRSHLRVDLITPQSPKLENRKYPDDYEYVFNHHHGHRDEIGYDPCDVYEWVSGVKIHSGEDDTHFMRVDYYPINQEFVRHILDMRRLVSLDKLGI